jgi:hypothetical protein
MKYPIQFIAILLLTTVLQLQAQQTCNLHIVTSPDNYMMGFPFQFDVNGRPYKLKAGQCLELKLSADSIHIIMKDKRWVKKETVDLHIKAEADLYVRIFSGWFLNDRKRIRFFAEAVCKSCFEELKPKCKKEFTE